MKNHLGSYECKLCLTLHNNEGSYLAHTQGKKHQANLARRAAKEAIDAPAQPAPEKVKVEVRKFVKIGRPGYKVTKQREPETAQQSLLFQIDYPEIAEGVVPRHRFMSAYEQKIEPPDKKWIRANASFGPIGTGRQSSSSFSLPLNLKTQGLVLPLVRSQLSVFEANKLSFFSFHHLFQPFACYVELFTI